MGKLFDLESPIMTMLGKVADLVLLNFITIIMCIPILTIGASLTACYYAALKIKRGEGYPLRNFWKSFKENFWGSMIIFFIYLILGIMLSLMGNMLSSTEMGAMLGFFKGFYFMLLFTYVATLTWVFAIQSRFRNSITLTIIKTLILSTRYLLRTIVMLVVWAVPIYIFFSFSFKLFSLLFVFGISVPVYLSVKLYNKIFELIEDTMVSKEDI